MKYLIKKIGILVSAGGLLVLYTNMGSVSDSFNFTNEARQSTSPPIALPYSGVDLQKLVSDYSRSRDQRLNGTYSSKATQFLKLHETKMVNYLSFKVGAQKCQDIRRVLPEMESGNYKLADPTKEPTTYLNSYCVSNAVIASIASM